MESRLRRERPGSNHILFRRPATALAVHQPHELSEIPELSCSSKTTLLKHCSPTCGPGGDGHLELTRDVNQSTPQKLCSTITSSNAAQTADPVLSQSFSRLSNLKSLSSSTVSLPIQEIPKRKSSVSALSQTCLSPGQVAYKNAWSCISNDRCIQQSTRQANSPVKYALNRSAQSSDALRPSPSKTFVRTITPFHLLDGEKSHNSRFNMSIRLPSPLFVGGGTVEGQIEISIDTTSSKKTKAIPMFISQLSVDIIGVEEVDDGRRWVFLSLATELFDCRHPPPSALVYSRSPEKGSELYWRTRPATATVPFCLHLPLKLGPPPYWSRQARIRYLLCPSAIIKAGEKRIAVRQSWAVQMLTTHDPEKALASLPSPLLAEDTLLLSHAPVIVSVKLTAGLHRQTWMSGGVIFTDVHVLNNTKNTLKRMQIQLEKSTLWFSHPAPGTVERQGNHLRLPEKIETDTISRNIIKNGKGWDGVAPRAAEVRTCELEIPKGHVTIGNGRFFEVRYYVKVTLFVARNKSVSVQLPVIIIHMNSLDIMPNSLAQVAASIEAKRSIAITRGKNKAPCRPHSQGQAFVVARQQSLGQAINIPKAEVTEVLKSLAQEVDNSRHHIREPDDGRGHDFPDGNLHTANSPAPCKIPSCHRHLQPRPSCYHCHLLHTEHANKISPRPGPKLPRLQVSTSGLGFSETEFEMPPDSPRKVMLSEKERQMINQQHELKLQRQWSQQRTRNSLASECNGTSQAGLTGWKNVTVLSSPRSSGSEPSKTKQKHPMRHLSQRNRIGMRIHRSHLPSSFSGENRARTKPEQLRASFSDSVSARKVAGRSMQGKRSMDQGQRRHWSGCDMIENDVFGPRKKAT